MKTLLPLYLVIILFACSPYSPGKDIPMERQRALADALRNQNLYAQAVTEYTNLLERYKLDVNLRAEINYTIGNIYFEQFNDYQNALTYFMKIKHLFGANNRSEDANNGIIACLERLGRSVEAARIIEETGALTERDSPFERLPGDTVAVVNNEVLTSGELDRIFTYYFNLLLPEQREEPPTREQKLGFLRDYIKSEVLYNSAKRRNIDKTKEFVELEYLQKKDLMIQKLLQSEVYDKIAIDDSEIEKYFTENRDKFTETAADGTKRILSLEDARDIIRQLLFSQEAQKLQDQMTDSMIEVQNAQIFIDRVK